MRNGATTLQTTSSTADRPAGPPPGPRSAGLPPTAPLLQRAPRRRPAPLVRQVVDLEAGSLLELLEGPVDRAVDESVLSIQDRVRLRAQEAARR